MHYVPRNWNGSLSSKKLYFEEVDAHSFLGKYNDVIFYCVFVTPVDFFCNFLIFTYGIWLVII